MFLFQNVIKNKFKFYKLIFDYLPQYISLFLFVAFVVDKPGSHRNQFCCCSLSCEHGEYIWVIRCNEHTEIDNIIITNSVTRKTINVLKDYSYIIKY